MSASDRRSWYVRRASQACMPCGWRRGMLDILGVLGSVEPCAVYGNVLVCFRNTGIPARIRGEGISTRREGPSSAVNGKGNPETQRYPSSDERERRRGTVQTPAPPRRDVRRICPESAHSAGSHWAESRNLMRKTSFSNMVLSSPSSPFSGFQWHTAFTGSIGLKGQTRGVSER